MRKSNLCAFLVFSIACMVVGCSSGLPALSQDYTALDPNLRMTQANQQVVCMKDKGFAVLPDAQGGVRYGNDQVPEDQVELANKAIRECYDELGFNDIPVPTDAQVRKLYTLNLEAKKCLEGLKDVKLAISDPPSEQSFVETFSKPDNVPWSPWGAETMKQMPPDEKTVNKIRLECPDPLNYVNSF